MKQAAGVIFRKIRGRIVPIYKRNRTAADAGLAAGAFLGAAVVAQKSREQVAGRLFYKGRKGFGNDLANFGWDTAVQTGVFYAAYQNSSKVRSGAATIMKFLSKRAL